MCLCMHSCTVVDQISMTHAYLIKIRSDSSYHYALSRHNQRGSPFTRFQTQKKQDPNTQEMIDTASPKPSQNKLKCLRLMTIHRTRSPSHNEPFVYVRLVCADQFLRTPFAHQVDGKGNSHRTVAFQLFCWPLVCRRKLQTTRQFALTSDQRRRGSVDRFGSIMLQGTQIFLS